jgi:prepilin-type N-terminal cleavage/methylation domain-containing protein
MRKDQGLTLIEVLVVISILLIILGITIQSFRYFQGNEALSDSAEKIINILRMAQSRTLASEGSSQYGVYFNDITDPQQYILFKLFDSVSYNDPLRNTSSDEVHEISKSVEIYDIDLVSGHEVVFSRLSGETLNSGTVSLWLKSDHSKTRTVSIETSGKITLGTESAPTGVSNRIRDTRHIHFTYNPPVPINTATESLTLELSADTKIIPISSYIPAGQIYWEGELNNQKIKIHTHYLNDPINFTIFSIHRDWQDYNDPDKALKISISGDPIYLVEYTDDCNTITKGSLNVNEDQCQ